MKTPTLTPFQKVTDIVSDHVNKMMNGELYTLDVDSEEVWSHYLNSFPQGSDPMFLSRTEHNCTLCKNYIRRFGLVVSIQNGELVTIWDVNVDSPYKEVFVHLSTWLKTKNIKSPFLSKEKSFGCKQNFGTNREKFYHFFVELPNKFVTKDVGTKLGEINSTVGVFRRGLEELKEVAFTTTLELISQNSLYRGQEFKKSIEEFYSLWSDYQRASNKDLFIWLNYKSPASRIRNTAIGTLLIDLSNALYLDEKTLDRIIGSYEHVVAPTNYKRPTSLVTQSMIDKALVTIKELGLEESLYRRGAIESDITINEVLYSDRSLTNLSKGTLEDLLKPTKSKEVNLSTVQTVTMSHFIKELIPNLTKVEIFFDSNYQNNLMTLTAPKNKDSKNLFKWDNPFAWVYNGNVTDSIKEKVKQAGGNVLGDVRVSLSWENLDDLDLHVVTPQKEHIYFANKKDRVTKGELDIDMNCVIPKRGAVENIFWKDKSTLTPGLYTIIVDNYTKRESKDQGYTIEIDVKGKSHFFSSDTNVKKSFFFTVDSDKNFIIEGNSQQSGISKEIWGINTNQFVPVKMITTSPNYWNGAGGNFHYLFILDRCKPDEPVRGFFNEYLSNFLDKHRKVLEMIGNRLTCEPVEDQLSGLGFSSTTQAEILFKVSGQINRTLKVTL